MTSISTSPEGLKIVEPAADLAAAAALISSLTGASLPRDAVYFGEIGLSGSVRAVAHAGLRLKEAAKLGFARAFAPHSPRAEGEPVNIAAQPIGNGGGAGRADCRERSRNEGGTRQGAGSRVG